MISQWRPATPPSAADRPPGGFKRLHGRPSARRQPHNATRKAAKRNARSGLPCRKTPSFAPLRPIPQQESHRRERNKKEQKDVQTAHFGTSTAKQAACKRPHITNHANKKGASAICRRPDIQTKAIAHTGNARITLCRLSAETAYTLQRAQASHLSQLSGFSMDMPRHNWNCSMLSPPTVPSVCPVLTRWPLRTLTELKLQ